MTTELASGQIEIAIKKLEQLNLPENGLCDRCQNLKFCQFKTALIASGNLGKEKVSHFNSLLKPHNGNFHNTCTFVHQITEVVNNP